MSYEEAVQSTVSRTQAKREIERHSLKFADFIAECGDKPEYSGAEVLAWLGY